MKQGFFLFLLTIQFYCWNQQTVGLFEQTGQEYPGYILFGPANSDTTYLIDNCGYVQYKWESDYNPGASVYLLNDGSLLRTEIFDDNSGMNAGGAGGRIECIHPNQSINWDFNYSNSEHRQHHDVAPMLNGNVLIIAWDKITEQEALDLGRDPANVNQSGLWPESIVEYNPTLGQIVWEWYAIDHIVQDYDSNKPNYGVVADHPELFDFNFTRAPATNPDWQHFNSIDYNESLDQILLCSPFFNEIYIIDHSTTTQEAATHSGGNSGKGGDILWRWGNPLVYDQGDESNQQLYFQHDAHWIAEGLPYEGQIMVYNNGQGRQPAQYSSVDIIQPSILSDGSYEMNANNQFLPNDFSFTYIDPLTPTDFYSPIISSAQMLPNGNILIDEGSTGHFFEINSNHETVWDYVNPAVKDSVLAQEQTIPGTAFLLNMTFRAKKYMADYPGVLSLDLLESGPLEREAYEYSCYNGVGISELQSSNSKVYPNPMNDILQIYSEDQIIGVEVFDVNGQLIIQTFEGDSMINVADLRPGVYFVNVKTTTINQIHKVLKN